MTCVRALAITTLLLTLAACSGQQARTPMPDAADATAAASEVENSNPDPIGIEPDETDSSAGDSYGTDPYAQSSDALYTDEFFPQDPWENFNRKVHSFNDVIDRALLRPVAKGYTAVAPRVVRIGISNFFSNLQQPISGLNLLLQGHPLKAGSAIGRFLINATVGLGGILDPASDADIPMHTRDFGQTLARWGWKESRYVVLPVFGPSTLRDGLGKSGSSTVSPVTWLARRHGAQLSLLYGVDARASVLPLESMLDGAADPYLLIRDAYLQRRRCQIVDCSGEMPDYLLPDYDFEIPDFDTLR